MSPLSNIISPQAEALQSAFQALSEARTLEDIKDVRDRAEAVRKYVHSAALGLDLQNRAAELRLRAERKAGQILRTLSLRGGARRKPNQRQLLTLKQLGVSRNQSHRWQLEAAVPEEVFNRYIATTTQLHRELTAAGLLKLARSFITETNTASTSLTSIHRQLEALITAGAVFRCLYVNPPWPKTMDKRHDRGLGNASLCVGLRKLPIRRLIAREAHIHLWAGAQHVVQACRLMRDWGFSYGSCLVLTETHRCFGPYWRESHHFLLLGVRGDLTFRDNSLPGYIRVDRRNDSQIRDLIERVSYGPYLELFGECQTAGWTAVEVHETLRSGE